MNSNVSNPGNPDDEFEPGNLQHVGENRQGGERLGDSLSASIGIDKGNVQHRSGGARQAMPTVPED